MKKLLLTLTLLLTLGFAASAETVAFKAISASNVPTADSDVELPTVNAAKISASLTDVCDLVISNGYSDADGYARWYSGANLTITPQSNITINSITINCGDKKYGTITCGQSSITTSSSSPKAEFNNLNSTSAVTLTNSAQIRFNYILVEYTKASTTPEITAVSGETVYEAGEIVNEVAKGTVVTFTVTNCDDADISADPDLTFTNGAATATINADVTYTIMAGADVIEEFNFKVVKPEITAEKIIIKANGEAINAEDIELYAGTELTFDYADAIEGIIFSYTTDAETYTTATSYIFNPGEESEVTVFVKASCDDVSDEKGLTVTKKAVATPTFTAEDGIVFVGDVIKVNGDNVAWTVAKNGGDAEPVSGSSYTVNDEKGTELVFTATASVSINDITTTSESATLSVTVDEATNVMYDFNKSDAYGLSPKSGDTNADYETEVLTITTDPIVTVTVSGTYRLVTVSGEYALRLHATKNNKGVDRLTVSVPSDYYITGITFGTGSTNTNTPNNAEVTEGTSVALNKWDMGGLQLSEVYIQRNGSNPSIKTMTVSYAKRETELVGITTEFLPGKTQARVDYMLHLNYHKDANEYVVELTIPGIEEVFTNATHTDASIVEETANAPMRVLNPDDVASETTLKGQVMATGLEGEHPYGAATLVAKLGSKVLGTTSIENFTTGTTGIEDVTVENEAAAEYFNLQGVRVAEPQAGRIYIVRRGAKATKELVK